jgi:hypothetical protein
VRTAVGAVRVAAAVAIVAAVITQFVNSLGEWQADPTAEVPYQVANFFSFFTIESNVASTVVLAIGGVALLRGAALPAWFDVVRLCVATYMTITGVVYNLLLRSIELPQGSTVDWANEVMHVVAPLVLVLDWVLVHRGMSFRTLGVIVVYPLAWVAYTLLRGAFTVDTRLGRGWYPYPFLDPHGPDGVAGVVFYVIAIAVGFLVAGAVLVLVSRGRAVVSTAR